MPTKKKRTYPAKRTYNLRSDSSIASAEKEIASVFGLPSGSIKLVNPNGRKARGDKYVGTLLADWE